MNRTYSGIARIYASILLLAVPATAAAYIITPGRSVGGVTLGTTRGDVHRKLGRPLQTQRGALLRDFWPRNKGTDSAGSDSLRVIFRSDKAIQIEVVGERANAAENALMRKSFAEISRQFPHLRFEAYGTIVHGNATDKEYFYEDVKRGITFVFDPAQDSVEPQSSQKPRRIIIHRPGHRPLPSAGLVKISRD
jgi:hypothetical protein